jgi:hypothetical protein
MRWFSSLLIALLLAASLVHASEADGADGQFLGGPTSIGKELSEASEVDSIDAFGLGEFRARLIDQRGLAVSAGTRTTRSPVRTPLWEECCACTDGGRW